MSVSLVAGLLALCAAAESSAQIGREASPGLQAMAIEAYVEAYPNVSRVEAARRVALQDRVAPYIDDLQGALGEAASGAWFDANEGGRLKLGVLAASIGRSEQPAVRGILRAHGIEADVKFVAQRFDFGALQAALGALNDNLQPLIAAGKVSTQMDLPSNTLVLETATTLTAADVARLDHARSAATVPIQVRQTGRATLIATRAACDNPVYVTCDRPLRGGPQIFTSGGHQCTAGFNAADGTGRHYLVTAGHCLDGDGGATWLAENPGTGTFSIGTRTNWRYGSDGDFGSIRLPTDSHWYRFPPAGIVFVGSSPYTSPSDPATTRDETYPIYGRSTSVVGAVLCFTSAIRLDDGRFTDCGAVRALGRSVTYDDGVTVEGLGVLGNESVVRGASGGPLYKSGYGYGLTSGFDDPDNELFYQGLTGALTTLALHLPNAGT